MTVSTADISPCRKYRYRLMRWWGEGPFCAFIMFNPSTADEMEDDPTIRRCINFAKREGCGGMVVGNLFALRSHIPTNMQPIYEPVGPENDETLIDIMHNTNGPVIAAWGALSTFFFREREEHVMRLTNVPMHCLGVTKAGDPRHPLYLRKDAPLIDFR